MKNKVREISNAVLFWGLILLVIAAIKNVADCD